MIVAKHATKSFTTFNLTIAPANFVARLGVPEFGRRIGWTSDSRPQKMALAPLHA